MISDVAIQVVLSKSVCVLCGGIYKSVRGIYQSTYKSVRGIYQSTWSRRWEGRKDGASG